jgi:hypothetical protein
MSITEILDAVAPGEHEQALALMLIAAACERACAAMLDDVPLLVAAMTED